jgi:hypothetical protein
MLTISLLPKEYNIQTGHFRAIMKEKIPVILATSILILFTFQGYPTLQNTQASLTYHKIELPPPPLPPMPDNDSLVVELPHVPVFDLDYDETSVSADFSNRYYSPDPDVDYIEDVLVNYEALYFPELKFQIPEYSITNSNNSKTFVVEYGPVFEASVDFKLNKPVQLKDHYIKDNTVKYDEPKPDKELLNIYKAIDEILDEKHKGFK